MKNIATLALLTVAVTTVYAHDRTVRMTFSGTEGGSPINLQQPNTTTGEADFAGNGTLGPFTYHNVEANGVIPQASSACSGATQLYLTTMVGTAVFRFQDGSLLKVNLTEGADCIDLAAQEAHCTRIFQISGGTGRFKNASGGLTLTFTAVPVLADALNNPVFFVATGELTGTISGVSREEDSGDKQQ